MFLFFPFIFIFIIIFAEIWKKKYPNCNKSQQKSYLSKVLKYYCGKGECRPYG